MQAAHLYTNMYTTLSEVDRHRDCKVLARACQLFWYDSVSLEECWKGLAMDKIGKGLGLAPHRSLGEVTPH